MMAKMFYTLDEAKTALAKNEEEIKQLTREGRLREFRDGPRLMFKADQVDQLKEELKTGMDRVDLGPSDSGMAIGLADSGRVGSGAGSGAAGIGSGVGSGITSGSGLTLADDAGGRSPGAGMNLKDDTALAADLGLSGSVGGVPSPAGRSHHSGSGTGLSGSRSGINVFQNDEVERVDPSAQTSLAGSGEQASLESVGSGSGLLDLTRESDDTSLGAELLDEIAPSGTASGLGRTTAETAAGSGAGIRGIVDGRGVSGGIVRGGAVQYVEKPDPMAPAFGGAALAAAAVVIFGAFALITGILGTQPPIMQNLKDNIFAWVAGGGAVLTLIFFIVGVIVGKTAAK